jgi:hypothetical protein
MHLSAGKHTWIACPERASITSFRAKNYSESEQDTVKVEILASLNFS